MPRLNSSDKQVELNDYFSAFIGRSVGAGNCQTISRWSSVSHLNLGEFDFTRPTDWPKCKRIFERF